MAATPVHLSGHGASLELIGLVVSINLAAMFAPAPVTGRLVDRMGALPVTVVGAAVPPRRPAGRAERLRGAAAPPS